MQSFLGTRRGSTRNDSQSRREIRGRGLSQRGDARRTPSSASTVTIDFLSLGVTVVAHCSSSKERQRFDVTFAKLNYWEVLYCEKTSLKWYSHTACNLLSHFNSSLFPLRLFPQNCPPFPGAHAQSWNPRSCNTNRSGHGPSLRARLSVFGESKSKPHFGVKVGKKKFPKIEHDTKGI